jgi:hypothetical protein
MMVQVFIVMVIVAVMIYGIYFVMTRAGSS